MTRRKLRKTRERRNLLFNLWIKTRRQERLKRRGLWDAARNNPYDR